jgi:hypothetical protein
MTTKAEQSTLQSKHDQFVKQFADETGVSPVAATIIWHIKQAFRLLHDDVYWRSPRDFNRRDSFEINYAFKNLVSAVPPPEGTLAAEQKAEQELEKAIEDFKKRLEAEKKRQTSEEVGE